MDSIEGEYLIEIEEDQIETQEDQIENQEDLIENQENINGDTTVKGQKPKKPFGDSPC